MDEMTFNMKKMAINILCCTAISSSLAGCYMQDKGYDADFEKNAWQGEWEKQEYRNSNGPVAGDPVLPLDPAMRPCASAALGNAGCNDGL
jgi:hypothetical protein